MNTYFSMKHWFDNISRVKNVKSAKTLLFHKKNYVELLCVDCSLSLSYLPLTSFAQLKKWRHLCFVGWEQMFEVKQKLSLKWCLKFSFTNQTNFFFEPNKTLFGFKNKFSQTFLQWFDLKQICFSFNICWKEKSHSPHHLKTPTGRRLRWKRLER